MRCTSANSVVLSFAWNTHFENKVKNSELSRQEYISFQVLEHSIQKLFLYFVSLKGSLCYVCYVLCLWLSRNYIIFLDSYVRNKKTLIIQEVCFLFTGTLKTLLEIELIFFIYLHLSLKFVSAIEQNLHHFLNLLIFMYKFAE